MHLMKGEGTLSIEQNESRIKLSKWELVRWTSCSKEPNPANGETANNNERLLEYLGPLLLNLCGVSLCRRYRVLICGSQLLLMKTLYPLLQESLLYVIGIHYVNFSAIFSTHPNGLEQLKPITEPQDKLLEVHGAVYFSVFWCLVVTRMVQILAAHCRWTEGPASKHRG